MVSWLIIGIVIVLGIIILKANHFKHRFWIMLLILIALFLYISIITVHNKYNLNADSTEGFFNSAKTYVGWLANGFQNLKTITGHATKMDWASSDESIFNKTNSSSKSNINTNNIKK